MGPEGQNLTIANNFFTGLKKFFQNSKSNQFLAQNGYFRFLHSISHQKVVTFGRAPMTP